MKRVVKPDAKVEIQTGEVTGSGSQTRVSSWPYGVVMVRKENGSFVEHPGFQVGGKTGQHRRFLIELLSDNLRFNFQSHLSCYTGRIPFCQRAHRGHDQTGVARRRDELGGLYSTECDPDRCPLRQNHAEPDSRTGEIVKKWAVVYPYGKLRMPRGKDVFGAKCMPENYLLFNLLLPDGQTYAHAEGECCVLATHSEVTHGWIQSKLEQLFARTYGQLTGLRLFLQYSEFETRFNKTSPAWRLEVPEETDFEMLRAQAGRRAQLRQIDYSALPPGELDKACTSIVKVHESQNLALLSAQYPEAMRQVQTAVEQMQVDASYIDPRDVYLINQEPLVQALIRRIGVSYARETAFPMMFGADMRRCIDWLRATAAATVPPVDISDLLPAKLPEPRALPNAALPELQPEPAAEAQDAEYEVIDDRTDEELERDVRGGNLPDPLQKTPEELAEIARLREEEEAAQKQGLF
jgi:hypothetical protein